MDCSSLTFDLFLQDMVEVNFEFFDPKPDDFHGAKALLQTYLDDTEWNINEFVDLFLAQTTVGSVIKTAEDESPIGIITAFNLARYEVRISHNQVNPAQDQKLRAFA
jgi:hypothetical protein